MQPTAHDVEDFLGRYDANTPPSEQTQAHLAAVTAMVRAYTRGRDFIDTGEPADDLALVIITSVARLVGNPNLDTSAQKGDVVLRHTIFDGWTLPELAVLHSYRRRAA